MQRTGGGWEGGFGGTGESRLIRTEEVMTQSLVISYSQKNSKKKTVNDLWHCCQLT